MSSKAVHTGFWINWAGNGGASGTFMGSTLTLPRQQGAVLGNFLAIFTALAIANLWPITCFIVHQWRSTSSPRAGFYHQQQAVLSNTLSPAASALSFLKIFWAWRREKVNHLFRTSVLLLLVACFLMALSTAAGLATARIQLKTNEVLANPVTCGWVAQDLSVLTEPEDPESTDLEEMVNKRIIMSAWGRWIASRNLEYVRRCYDDGVLPELGTTLAKPDLCETYTVPRLNVSTRAVDCPFDKEICTSHGGLQVEIGLVDSNKHLGINGDEGDRIMFRKTMTCAPILAEEKFSTPWIDERPTNISFIEGDRFKYYHLGNQSPSLNYSWAVSNSSLRGIAPTREEQVHRLGTVHKLLDADVLSTFEPARELQVPDSDITVVYLVSNARYSAPVKDPWFAATNRTDPTGANRFVGPDPVYISDRVASALGCTEQYQFCTPDGICSEPSGVARNITQPWRSLELGGVQQGAFNILTSALTVTTIADCIMWLGPQILRANDFLWFGDGTYFSSGLPADHWQDEVRNFGQSTAAALQSIVVHYATRKSLVVTTAQGPVDAAEYLMPPRTVGERAICDRVRVRNSQYTSFSVAGVAVTLVIGVVIILLNLCALPGAAFWIGHKLRRAEQPYQEHEWRDGHLLMQQKRALESEGFGPWVVDEMTGVPRLRGDCSGEGARGDVVADQLEKRCRVGKSMTHMF